MVLPTREPGAFAAMTLAQFLVIFFGPVALLALFFFAAWFNGRKKLPR